MSDLPKEWECVCLTDFVYSVPTGLPKFLGNRKYYSTGSINGKIFLSEGEYSFDNRPSRANRIAMKDDVFQARMQNTDKALLIQDSMSNQIFSTGFLQFRPVAKTYDSKLLFYFVKSNYFLKQRDELATGSTQIALTDTNAVNLKLIVPPLNEQQRIVAKLEKLLHKVDACKERLDKIPVILKRFRQSVLAAACSGRLTADWREKNPNVESAEKLLKKIRKDKIKDFKYRTSQINKWLSVKTEDIFDSFGGGTPSKSNKKYWNGKIPWVSSGDVKDDEIEEGSLFITQEGLENSSAKICSNNSVIVVVRSGILKHTLPVSIVKKPLAINQDIKCFDSGNKELNLWLFINIKAVQNEILALNREGTTVQSVKYETLQKFEFNLPPFEEQQEIIRRIKALFKKVDEIEARYQKAKVFVDRLTQSILAKAFRGELVPQDPNDEPASVLLERIREERAKKETSKKSERIFTRNKIKLKKNNI